MTKSLIKKSFIVIAIIVSTCFVLLSRYTTVDNIGLRKREEKISFPVENGMKTILYWTEMFSRRDFCLGFGSTIFQNCAYNNCYVTDDRNFRPIDEFDALIFHGVEYREDMFGKPTKRNKNQRYIFFCLESPMHSNRYMENTKNFYNWTMTYRSDSDVHRPYGLVYKQRTYYQPPTIEEIRKRPKKIAWMVSNCDTPSGREAVARELGKFLPVDVYGNCGPLNCSRDISDECYKMTEKNYKFYLSFENSLCDEYVTEKLFNILKLDIVPIVYGSANYSKIAPPHSVINVKDYASVQDLANYIKYLDAYPEEYLRFFEWKKSYMVDNDGSQEALCNLCTKLNYDDFEPKTYRDIVKWWRGTDYNKCHKVKKLGQIGVELDVDV